MTILPRHFRTQLLLSYVLLVIVPLSLLFGLIYRRTASVIDAQVEAAAMSAMQQAASFVEYQLEYLRRVSELVANTRGLRDILSRPPGGVDLSSQLDDYTYLRGYIASLESRHGPYRIRLYIDDRWFYSRERYSIHAFSEFADVDLSVNGPTVGQIMVLPEREVRYFHDDIQFVLTLINVVQVPASVADITVIVCVDSLSANMRSVFGEMLKPYGGQARLVDDMGQPLLDVLVEPFGESEARSSVAFRVPLGRSAWTLEARVPVQRLYAPRLTLQRFVTGAAVAVILAMVGLGVLLSQVLSRRVTSLVDAIRAIEGNALNSRASVVADDEIGLIETEFNAMVSRIGDLVSQVEADARAMRELELEALQVQINPHFLYNTLDLISWKALKHNATDLHELVVTMARFYKVSLARGEGIVNLESECEHVRLYVAIENMRFDNLVTLEFDVAEPLLAWKLPKITLQPLVENSIHHGILESGAGSGTVRIRARAVDDCLVVEVDDDGETFLRDTGWHPTDGLNVFSSGFGIRNVQERLRLIHGADCRLEFRSRPERGTTARITIPDRQNAR